jgi:hypothetical protein
MQEGNSGYPLHMMVLKNVSYIQYGCGKQSVVVYSLNNVIMPLFHSSIVATLAQITEIWANPASVKT